MNKLKIIFLGEIKVGKTRIISQYINYLIPKDYIRKISYEKYEKQIELNKNKIDLEIWEINGKLNYRYIKENIINNSQIVFLVYDTKRKKTFSKLNEWYESVYQILGNNNIFYIVIANKTDLNDIEVEKDEGEQYSKSINAFFYEICLKDNQNFEQLFNNILNIFIKQINKLKEENNNEKKEEIINKEEVLLYNNYEEINYIKVNKKGKGKVKYKNGDYYEGDWKNDKKEGKGKMKYKNDDYYKGDWEIIFSN